MARSTTPTEPDLRDRIGGGGEPRVRQPGSPPRSRAPIINLPGQVFSIATSIALAVKFRREGTSMSR